MTLQVFQLPFEEAYLAHSIEDVQQYFVERLGYDPDEFDPDEWVEQTGPITLTLEADDISREDLHSATLYPGKLPGTFKVTKDAALWVEQFRSLAEKEPFCLWTTHQ